MLLLCHTNTAGGYISSYHNRTLASLEFVQDPVAFILLFVAMDSYDQINLYHQHVIY